MGRSYGYAAYPYSYGAYSYAAHPYSYGSYHAIGNRSADAEPAADADAYYGGYYGLGAYGYSGLGYRSYGYAAHPYSYGSYHAIGKRSADAEPAADADAYYGG